jgi:ABC-type transport system substrate-binding protein
MWMLGSSATAPDGQGALAQLYGPESGQQNLGRFKMAEFDKIYERMQALPDGEERNRLIYEAKRITAAYLPIKVYTHRIANELTHPWLFGYRRSLFWNNWWHMVDIDPALRPATT